ncbi:hypothetical protein G5I_13326 [Acromyrmex echinatior]|uniref:Ig-like domain-containing protein n=1 Tax=Acromyrmex echinatior TaxID=103372 RepID=F4X4Q7_ACREC|nr:hypothetical protein G5I_13326 [Acromyrmex echinatior]
MQSIQMGDAGRDLLSPWYFIENHGILVITAKASTATYLESGREINLFSLLLQQHPDFSRCDAYLGDLPSASLENGSTPYAIKGKPEKGEARRSEVRRRSKVVISSAKPEDSGRYECVAESTSGHRASLAAELLVAHDIRIPETRTKISSDDTVCMI